MAINNLNILVTGGAGYIGSILCEHLLKANYQVTVIDNLMYHQTSLLHLCHHPNFNFVLGDARDEREISQLLKKADVLIPLAAIVGAPACDRDTVLAEAINLTAIQSLLRLRSKNQLVIYPNTNSGYGVSSGETYCTEESPLNPVSFYGQIKVQAEIEVINQPNTITFRLATVFGSSSRMRLDLLVNYFVYASVTDGYIVIFEKDFKRNYIHVRDVADCFLHAIENHVSMLGNTYNLGLDKANLSKEELALKIRAYVPDFYIHFSEIKSDPDKRNYIVSNQKLKNSGFEAKRTLDQGIEELLKTYQMLKFSPLKNA